MAETKAKAKKKPAPKELTEEQMKEELAAKQHAKAAAFMGEYKNLCDKYGVDRVTDAITMAGGQTVKMEPIIFWKQ